MSGFSFSASPAFRLAVLVIAGILASHWVDPPLLLLTLTLGAVTLVAGVLFMFRSPSRILTQINTVAVLAVCVLGGAAKLALDRNHSATVPDSLFFRPATAIGTIIEPPIMTGRVMRFVMEAHELRSGPDRFQIHEHVRVSLVPLRGEQVPTGIDYGAVVALHGGLSRPSAERNPGDFSEKQFYEASGITMFIVARGIEKAVVLDSAHGSWLMREVVLPSRSYILQVLGSTSRGEAASLLKGLMIGERSGIDASTRQAFTNSGVAHVLAVSGSNVVVVAGIFFFAFGLLRFPKPAVVLSSVAMILLYMLITGSQPPVVRATITASIFLIGGLSQVKSNPFNSLGVAALLILAIDARQLFDVGFQLSFAAVLSIVYLYPMMNGWISTIRADSLLRKGIVWTLRVCAVSLAASLGTLPMTAVYFGKVSVVGLLANIIVIPVVGASVVLGFVTVAASLLGSWLAASYAAVNQLLLDCTIWLVRFAGDVSFAYVDTSRFFPIFAFPFYVALLFVCNLNQRVVARRLFIILLIAMNVAVLVPSPVALAATGKLRVSFLDVGQGDAAVLELPDGKTVVIDAGPRTGTYDAGERIVAPFLRRRGVSRIDLLVMSHPHDDHCGGMPFILDHFDVAAILESGQSMKSNTYLKYTAAVRSERCTVDTARLGMPIVKLGDMRLYVVFPTPSFIDTTSHHHPNLNNTSVVFRIQYGDVSFLFTGDAETDAEEEMVNRYGDFLHSSLLKVGHHGSKTSSTQEFLECVRPASAIISVGRYNKFSHPSEDVISRLLSLRSDVCRTDEEGAIIFESDGKALSRVDWR